MTRMADPAGPRPRARGTWQTPARLLLGVLGAGVALAGAWRLTMTLSPELLGWLGVWLAGVVIVHDAVLAPLAHVVDAGLRRGAAALGVPRTVRLLVASLLGIGGVWTLVLVPEIIARQRGPANPTVLAVDYGAVLGGMWALFGVIALAIGVPLTLRARRRTPSPAD